MGYLIDRKNGAARVVPDQAEEHRSRARRLVAAAAELLALARELDDSILTVMANDTGGNSGIAGEDLHSAGLARSLYRDRRLRARVFPEDGLFGEPAWDMLLDLYVAAQDGKRVPVTSACIGAAVPTTTALRWLTILENRGLVIREADENDARRVFVRLSDDAQARMEDYFSRTVGRTAGERRDDGGFMLRD